MFSQFLPEFLLMSSISDVAVTLWNQSWYLRFVFQQVSRKPASPKFSYSHFPDFFAFLCDFFGFRFLGSPNLSIISRHLSRSSAVLCQFETFRPANFKSSSIDSPHLLQGRPRGRAWYTHDESNFRGSRSQSILHTCPSHLSRLRAMYVSSERSPHSSSTSAVVVF